MTLITFQDGRAVMRDGKVGTGVNCCCDTKATVCDECEWPAQLAVTIAGIQDGYTWTSRGGGSPASGQAFAPACSEPAAPQIRLVGSALGAPAWTATKMVDHNGTFILDYLTDSGCESPIWYGDIPVATTSAASGVAPTVCNTSYSGVYVQLHKEMAFTLLSIDALPGSSGSGASGSVLAVGNPDGAITAVQLDSGGSGYAYEIIDRIIPTLSASISSAAGTGAVLSLVLQQTTDYDGKDVWTVNSISVTDGGAGYDDGNYVAFNVDDGISQVSGYGAVVVARQQPTVTAEAVTSTGSGASLSVVLNETTAWNGRPVWVVDSITVSNGGSGYDAGDTVTIAVTDGIEVSAASAMLTVSGGVITAVSLLGGGEFYKSDGVIESASVLYGGEYYKEDPTGVVHVDTPTVSVASNVGSGAVVTATVDDDLESATFGQVISLVIDANGAGYAIAGQAWRVSFLVTGPGLNLNPLPGSNLGVVGFLCEGADLSAYEQPASELHSLSACGTDLLDATYDSFLSGGIFPNGIVNMPVGADYSLSGFYACNDLKIIGSTFRIQPA